MKVKIKMEVLNASHKIVDGYGIVDAEPIDYCEHEYRLLENSKPAGYSDRYPDRFYCIHCLKIETK